MGFGVGHLVPIPDLVDVRHGSNPFVGFSCRKLAHIFVIRLVSRTDNAARVQNQVVFLGRRQGVGDQRNARAVDGLQFSRDSRLRHDDSLGVEMENLIVKKKEKEETLVVFLEQRVACYNIIMQYATICLFLLVVETLLIVL